MITLQVGVKIIFSNIKGQYLLAKRTGLNWGEGKWETFGGRIDPGTPLIDNLAREVLEETGLTYSGTPRLLMAQDILKEKDGNLAHVVRLTYTDVIPKGVIKLAEEHSEYRWFSLDELKSITAIDSYLHPAIALLP